MCHNTNTPGTIAIMTIYDVSDNNDNDKDGSENNVDNDYSDNDHGDNDVSYNDEQDRIINTKTHETHQYSKFHYKKKSPRIFTFWIFFH